MGLRGVWVVVGDVIYEWFGGCHVESGDFGKCEPNKEMHLYFLLNGKPVKR